jgi:ADP-heptose:LPS heptosyltransferase
MLRAIGWNLGLRGDIIMNTVAARSFKEQYPEFKLTLGVGPQFADMEPLFRDHPFFDAFHVYNSYDNWPDNIDFEYLNKEKYDIVFHGKPAHVDEWYKFRHQYAEAAKMNSLPIPSNLNPILTKWFPIEKLEKTIAFAPFAGYIHNKNNDKMLSQYKTEIIVKFIKQLGYKVLFLGGSNEPEIPGVIRLNSSYFESVKLMLGCQFLIHTDTGIAHAAGAYDFPRLGLYGYRYYGKDNVKNIIPLNTNSINLHASNVNDIDDELIFQKIEEIIYNYNSFV